MKVIFVSAFLNHHQIPLCEELRELSDEFYFISTEDTSNVGYQKQGSADYVLQYFDKSQNNVILQKLAEADIVIFGACPAELIEYRMSQNKLSFIYAERYFKKGIWRRLIPSTRKTIKRKIINHSDKKLYVLAASAYLSYDLSLLGFSHERCFKWGYFPKIERYKNIGNILDVKDKGSILWCGRMIKLKHPEHAIKMAKRLRNRGYAFELNMIGDGPLKEKMQQLVDRLNLSDCVHILGSKSHDEVRVYMEKSQIFVFTSNRMEGWGAVVNEAMNGGCCVIASHAVGSVPFLIENGGTGEVYKSGSVKDLTEKVALLLNDNARMRAIGERAYNSLVSEWNATDAAKRLITLATYLLISENAPSYKTGPCSNAPIIKDDWYKEKGV